MPYMNAGNFLRAVKLYILHKKSLPSLYCTQLLLRLWDHIVALDDQTISSWSNCYISQHLRVTNVTGTCNTSSKRSLPSGWVPGNTR